MSHFSGQLQAKSYVRRYLSSPTEAETGSHSGVQLFVIVDGMTARPQYSKHGRRGFGEIDIDNLGHCFNPLNPAECRSSPLTCVSSKDLDHAQRFFEIGLDSGRTAA